MVGFILMMNDPEINISARSVEWLSWTIAIFAGLTMVSNVPFYSFKDVNFKKSVPFIVVFLIALGIALVAINTSLTLWPLFLIYVLSGYVIFFMRLAKGKPVSIVSLDE